MPHLTVEYSRNLAGLPERELLRALNEAVTAHPEIADESDLKSRLVVHDTFQVGTAPNARAFVHARLALLSGRTPEAKRELSHLVAGVLRRQLPRPAGLQVALSVEIVDMDRPSYVKEMLPAAD
ncbi:5-carboxymethyl-2-hydroxymuconate Delta-isomerase [Xylophilus sp. ASV27]|uniref:5-carboxymethyl-2-hydroxymuconate Delta-isomerase n=1 Tax=Xylophilus sp. ASV27 TaxID=2795129 RepID=UPI0018EC273F|nr:5-carboxymethyl-2-hydroxymuconate Delta-isomerase [Xylophilus sp. ASV27]